MKEILKNCWGKFYSFYSDPKRALSVVLVVFYIYFIFAWMTIKTYLSPVSIFLNCDFDSLLLIYIQALIVPIVILYLHQRLGSLHKKRVFFQFFFLLLTLSVLCFPYSVVVRNIFFANKGSKYQEAAQYAVRTYEQTREVKLVLPEAFDGLSDDRIVFVLRQKNGTEKVFFPIAPGLIAAKGFVCDTSTKQLQSDRRWKYRFTWGFYTSEGLFNVLWGSEKEDMSEGENTTREKNGKERRL